MCSLSRCRILRRQAVPPWVSGGSPGIFVLVSAHQTRSWFVLTKIEKDTYTIPTTPLQVPGGELFLPPRQPPPSHHQLACPQQGGASINWLLSRRSSSWFAFMFWFSFWSISRWEWWDSSLGWRALAYHGIHRLGALSDHISSRNSNYISFPLTPPPSTCF